MTRVAVPPWSLRNKVWGPQLRITEGRVLQCPRASRKCLGRLRGRTALPAGQPRCSPPGGSTPDRARQVCGGSCFGGAVREVAPSGSGQRVGRGPWATAPRELWRPEASPRQQRAAWQIPCSLGRGPRALTAASAGRDSNPARLCRLLRAGGQEGRQRAAHWPLGSRIRVARWPWAKKGSSSTEQAIGENPRVWPLMVVDSPGEVAGLPGRMGYHEAGWSPPNSRASLAHHRAHLAVLRGPGLGGALGTVCALLCSVTCHRRDVRCSLLREQARGPVA